MLDVVTKSGDNLLITAPVLVPNEKDCEFNFGEAHLFIQMSSLFLFFFKNFYMF